ncbi:hypothetical protein QP575_10260 [Alcaligenes faecalis subsp. phenolicus]|uniref:phage tail fiber protein n=1 Tax=Alcaligenes nematophilus TaxID=2994643 RepID=UPI002AA4D464|nr:hypothetical protein [Alcaligenes phenolicus]
MAWYRAGTIKVTANSATVTGTGTAWVQNARVGDGLQGPDGRVYEITNIASNTSLSITPAYQGASATGQTYWIIPVQGYVKQSADRLSAFVDQFGQLPAQVAGLGTASTGTLSTAANDSTSGRVARIGDWGLGVNNGLEADPLLLNNSSNGFYRSGSGANLGKPVNQSGDGYIKFGWSGSYKTYIYGSPVADALWYQNVNNGVAQGWKELMHVGHSGLGRAGADSSRGDVFPGADLSATGIGAGIYYVDETTGGASNLPFEGSTSSWLSGTLIHRESGTRGGQIFISSNGPMVYRGRGSSSHTPWKYVMARGDFGFGGAQATPDSWEAQKTGWYYKSGTKPSWGGGAFFLDLGYNTTDFNSGLRISTDPYTDKFYMNGAISNSKEYRPACELWHDRNTTVDSNGFIKRASPIVELAADGFKKTDHLEIKGIRFERVGTGHYVLHDAPLLSRDGWYIETPKDRNNNIYFMLDYEEDEQSKTLTIRTYEPDYSSGRATNGVPVDILEGRFVSLRFAEDPGLYPVYVPDPEPVPEPEPDIEPEVDADLEPLPDPPEPIEEPAA